MTTMFYTCSIKRKTWPGCRYFHKYRVPADRHPGVSTIPCSHSATPVLLFIATIKRNVFLLAGIACMLCIPATAAPPRWLPSPLNPALPDSLYQDDFFWYYAYDEALLIDSVTPYYPEKYPTNSPRKLTRMADKWEKRLTMLNLVGGIGPLTAESGSQATEAMETLQLSWPLFLATGDGRYMDVAERALYNGVRTALYPSAGKKLRQKAVNLMKGLHTMAYASSGRHLYINMYLRNNVRIQTDSMDVIISQMASWPWYGSTLLHFTPKTEDRHIVIHLRIPGWMRGEVLPESTPRFAFTARPLNLTVVANDETVPVKVKNGYLVIDRVWKATENYIKLVARTPTLRIRSTEHALQGKIAYQRGPIVYCVADSVCGGHVRASDVVPSTFDLNRRNVIMMTLTCHHQGNANTPNHPDTTHTRLALPYFQSFKENSGRCTMWLDENDKK